MTGAKYSQIIFIILVLMVFFVLKQTVKKSSLLMNMYIPPIIFALKLKEIILIMTSTTIMTISKNYFIHTSQQAPRFQHYQEPWKNMDENGFLLFEALIVTKFTSTEDAALIFVT